MNLLKKHNFISKLILLTLMFAFVGGQTIIANKRPADASLNPSQFEHAILTPNKFQINQGFTLMTSMSSGMSQTTGIYSNL